MCNECDMSSRWLSAISLDAGKGRTDPIEERVSFMISDVVAVAADMCVESLLV